MYANFEGYPHSQDAYAYACQVVQGHIDTSKSIQLSCQRFLDDFVKKGFNYSYDPTLAERACNFIEKLPHTKGKWAAQKNKLILRPWQKFLVCNIFGWVNADGNRRFRKVYAKIPRKNGKSILAAAIGLYLFCADNEYGAEIYSGATTEKQAWEVFRPAKQMVERTPDLREKFGIGVAAKNIHIIDNGSKFEPVIGNPGDGSSPSCAIIDEYHEHKTDDMVETMDTGMGARDQPLSLVITTAGSNVGGPCYDMETESNKVLNGVYEDDRLFVLIYGIDEGDDWTDPAILKKANPNYGVSVLEEFLLAQQQEAIRNASKQNAFKRKHLNQWVGAMTAWLNMEEYSACKDDSLLIENYYGQGCAFILDLASRIDLVAFIRMFKELREGKIHYTVFPRFFLPAKTAQKACNKHYEKWVNQGYIEIHQGDEININEIQESVSDEMNLFTVNELIYDPWRATQLAQALEGEGAEIVEFRNTVANMSPAMYELEAAITGGRFHHDGNPVMSWMMSNVVAKVDAKDNMYPRKEKTEQKIDGPVATIMGIGRMMHEEESNEPGIILL